MLAKILDYCYSPEMIELIERGMEGQTFYRDDKGNNHFTDEIFNAEDSRRILYEYGTRGSGACPGLIHIIDQKGNAAFKADIQKVIVDGKAIEMKMEDYFNQYEGNDSVYPGDLAPPVKLSPEELEFEINNMKPIDTYVEEMMYKFILGDESFDKWDEFIDNIKTYGDYDAVCDMYNKKLDK